jgi:O-antigen/teichoic acid export membrane protein
VRVTHLITGFGPKFREALSLIRVRSFETSTREGQSKERFRRIALTSIATAVAKVISIMVTLVSVPLTLNYLGPERYGLWLTVTSFTAFLGFADMGVGNGLINAVSEANGRNDRALAREYVSSAFFMLATVAAIVGIFLSALYPRIGWSRLFNVSSAITLLEVGPTVAIMATCFLISLPLGIVQRVQIGYQEGYIDSSWQCLGCLLGLGALVLAVHLEADLPLLALALAGSSILISLMNGMVLFGVRRPWLLPRLRAVQAASARRILKFGSLYLVLGVAGALGFQSDNMIIAYFLGVDHVPQYAVPMKLFMLIPMLLSFVLAPLWPAYGEAMARGDLAWIRRTFRRSLGFSLAMSLPCAALLTLVGSRILQLWVGPDIHPPPILLFGLGLWVVVNCVSGALAMFLNGASIIGFQVICAMLMGISNLAISIVLVWKIGVAGPVFGSIIAGTLFILLPSTLFIRRLFETWSKQPEIVVL